MVGKTCELCVATREKIVLFHNYGLSYQEIGDNFNLNFCSVRSAIKKEKETGSIMNKPVTGRPRELDTRQRRSIIEESSKTLF